MDVTRGPEIAAYEAALDHYFARPFVEAVAGIAPFAESDPPSKVLLRRCQALVAAPPPADRDGWWIAQSK